MVLGKIITALKELSTPWIYEKMTLFGKNFSVTKRMILAYLRVKPTDIILDFGCGTGFYCRLFKPENYIGFDLDAKRINRARKRYPGYKFHTMDVRNPLFKPRTFDHIMVVGIFHHIDDKSAEQALDNIRTLVKEKGDVVILEPTLSETSTNINRWMNFYDRGRYIRYRAQYEEKFAMHFEHVEAHQFINELLYNLHTFVLKKPRKQPLLKKAHQLNI